MYILFETQVLSVFNISLYIDIRPHLWPPALILVNPSLRPRPAWYNGQATPFVYDLRDREVACSASDRQGSNFESCVWRTVSSQSSHHPQEVLLAQFSLYVHKGGLKPDSFHFIYVTWVTWHRRGHRCIQCIQLSKPTVHSPPFYQSFKTLAWPQNLAGLGLSEGCTKIIYKGGGLAIISGWSWPQWGVYQNQSGGPQMRLNNNIQGNIKHR